MQIMVKNLPKGLAEVEVELLPEEIKAELVSAAEKLTKNKPIDGFRPGMAPYDLVKARFGEMAIYETAIEAVIRKTYVNAVVEHKLKVFGPPQVNVTKLVPGNPIAFTATVALVPEVAKLADFRSVNVKKNEVVIGDKSVDNALKDLQKMRTAEVRETRELRTGDKVVVDMDLSQQGVPLEGGQARNHGIYLDEEYYIPGLKDKLIGAKEGETRNFALPFPKDHYQKHLAGKDVDFAVTVKEIYRLDHPALDDEFAKNLGQPTLASLRELITKNMREEAAQKERQRVEIEILDKLTEKSSFGEVPEAIITAEVDRMVQELQHGIAERGLTFEDYLKNIKKTLPELKSEFTGQALKRIKTALLMRELGEKENLSVTDEELLAETQKQINDYSHDADSQERLRSEEYQDYLRGNLRNRKILDLLYTNCAK